jgi:hypothetical protein
MTKSVAVLAVPHQLQGPGFRDYVEDPSYPLLLKLLMRVHDVDFVFEEAAGRHPSVADCSATAFHRPAQYLDIDPPPEERPKYGIAMEVGGGAGIDPCHSPDYYESSKVDEQRKREELWVSRIVSTPFQKALVIVGVAHGLSVAFRLVSAGVSVAETYVYTPYSKLCSHRK